MSLIKREESKKLISRKVNLEEGVVNELSRYIDFLGYEKGEEKKATDHVINKALKYIFEKDKDYKKFLSESAKTETK